MTASSVWVRAASSSVEACARATSTSRVSAGSTKASTAALYCVRCFSSPANGAGQLQHANGVASGRGIENDVIKIVCQCAIREQCGEFVKRGDLGSAGTRE